jgi:hypothetical protein
MSDTHAPAATDYKIVQGELVLAPAAAQSSGADDPADDQRERTVEPFPLTWRFDEYILSTHERKRISPHERRKFILPRQLPAAAE